MKFTEKTPLEKGSQSSLPSYNEATAGLVAQTNYNDKEDRRKKVIPVQSDLESSSPSPDPLHTPPSSQSPVSVSRGSVRVSQSSFNLARVQEPEVRQTISTFH